jgi:hypothetical protein
MTTWIVVNRHVIAKNRKHGTSDPPIRISIGKHGQPRYASKVKITGPCEVVYDAHKPVLPCGARLAIKTESPVIDDAN